VQNFHATRTVHTVEGATQSIPGGPVASQEAVKNLGQNGGGLYNANAAHPFENPNPITNLLILWSILAIPFAFPSPSAPWPATGNRAGSSSPPCSPCGSAER